MTRKNTLNQLWTEESDWFDDQQQKSPSFSAFRTILKLLGSQGGVVGPDRAQHQLHSTPSPADSV